MLTQPVGVAVPWEIWEGIELVRLAERGVMPVAGGVLDQSQAFRELMLLVVAERARAGVSDPT
jgi:hypothetical protein